MLDAPCHLQTSFTIFCGNLCCWREEIISHRDGIIIVVVAIWIAKTKRAACLVKSILIIINLTSKIKVNFITLPHTGLGNQLRKNPHLAPLVVLEHIFTEPSPKLAQQNAIIARNQEILLRHAQGELGSDLAKEYGLSGQRISQIVYGQ